MDNEAFSPKLKAQILNKKKTSDKAKELSNQYREVKQAYPKVWKDLTSFIKNRIEDHERSIQKRLGAQIDPDNPNKLKLVPLTNEQIVTLLDKKAELEAIQAHLEQKVAINK